MLADGREEIARTHTPERNIARSVWIAAPGIALLYILGTCGMLAYLPRDRIDLIAPVSQILGAALHSSALAAALGGGAILALLFAYFTQTVGCVARVSRLPMVAGCDGLLPARFSALHPRFRTRIRSITLVVVSSWRTGGQPDIDGRGFRLQRAVLSRHVRGGAARKAACVGFDDVPILDVARTVQFGVKVAGAVVVINANGYMARSLSHKCSQRQAI
jgi:Amino acid permease